LAAPGKSFTARPRGSITIKAGLFAGLATPQQVGRYHSLVATSLPDELTATAHYGDLIMAIEHREAPLCAVQFHPESLLTPSGAEMMDTLLRWARAAAAAPDEQQKESGQ
jgi:anthranilate synthase component 2